MKRMTSTQAILTVVLPGIEARLDLSRPRSRGRKPLVLCQPKNDGYKSYSPLIKGVRGISPNVRLAMTKSPRAPFQGGVATLTRQNRFKRLLAAWKFAIVLGVQTVWGSSCAPRDEDPRTVTPSGKTPRLTVEFTGCREVGRGPTCVLGEQSELGLWVSVEPSDTVYAIRQAGTEEKGGHRAPVQGGWRHVVHARGEAKEIIVTAGSGPHVTAFRLGIRREAPLSWIASVQELLDLGDVDAAKRRLRQSIDNAPESQKGLGWSLAARIALGRDDPVRSEQMFLKAIENHRRWGRPSRVIEDTTALVYLWSKTGRRFLDMDAALEQLRPLARGHGDSNFYIANSEGLSAERRGDFRTALARYRAAIHQAERLDLAKLKWFAATNMYNVLSKLGRYRDATALFESDGGTLTGCERAVRLDAVGWSLIEQAEGGASHFSGESTADSIDPRVPLRRALELVNTHTCPKFPHGKRNILINLAFGAMTRDDAKDADRWLTMAQHHISDRDYLFEQWVFLLEGRIAAAKGRFKDALVYFNRLDAIARTTGDFGLQWRAAIGEARVYHRKGKIRRALDAYSRAEVLLDNALLMVALNRDRVSYLSHSRLAIAEQMELLIDDERVHDALDVARRARSRVINSLWRSDSISRFDAAQRAVWDETLSEYSRMRKDIEDKRARSWELPADELRSLEERNAIKVDTLIELVDTALTRSGVQSVSRKEWRTPEADELFLFYFPLPDAWIGFGWDREGLTSRDMGQLPEHLTSDTLSMQLLSPFADQIDRARRIVFFPIGRLNQIDFHALPWKGKPLMTARNVSYRVDLPPRLGTPRQTTRRQRSALVVVDPLSDLPEARRNSHAITRALSNAPGDWTVSTSIGPGTTRETLRRGLVDAELFHFSGHSVTRGNGGWDRALMLGRGELTIGDLLTLSRAPRYVVLLGCETAETRPVPATGIGLAEAFILIGSEAVIAATRPLEDRLAARFTTLFYSALDLAEADGETEAVDAAFHQAQNALRRGFPHQDWASLRLIIP